MYKYYLAIYPSWIVIQDSIPRILNGTYSYITWGKEKGMDSLLQRLRLTGKLVSFSAILWSLSAGKESPCQSFYHTKIVWSYLSVFRKTPLLGLLQRNWKKTVQRLPRRSGNIPMTRKADVQDTPIIHVSTVIHVKLKKSAVRMDARISQPINAACARNVPSIALILKRTSVLLRGNHLTFATAAGNSPGAPF